MGVLQQLFTTKNTKLIKKFLQHSINYKYDDGQCKQEIMPVNYIQCPRAEIPTKASAASFIRHLLSTDFFQLMYLDVLQYKSFSNPMLIHQ